MLSPILNQKFKFPLLKVYSILLLIFPFYLYSAVPPETPPLIDSLLTLAIGAESERDKVDLYNKVAFQYLFVDTLKSLEYIAKVSSISESIDYPQGIARATNIHAIHHSFQNRLKKGIELNKEALTYCQKDDHFVLGKIHNGLGLCYQRMYVVDKCLEHYHQALTHATAEGDRRTMAIVLGNIAGVHNTQNNDKEAKKYFLQLEEVAANLEDVNIQFAFNIRFAEFLTHADEFEESNTYLIKALEYSKLLNHKSKSRKVILQMVINAINLGEYKKAESHLSSLISDGLEPNDHSFMRYDYWYSELEYIRKNYSKATKHANDGLQRIKQKDDYYFYKPRLLKNLHLSEKKLGNFESAYIHLHELKQWQDSLELKERENKFIELESKYQSEKKEIENVLLSEQSKRKSAVIKQRTTIAIGSIITLLLALGIAYILYRTSRREREYNSLLETRVNERTKNLEQSNDALERFAYIASHDLKEPITTISAFITILKQKISTEHKGEHLEQYIDIIEKNCDQMKFLITGILDYTKLSEDVTKNEVDLNIILEKVELYLQKMILDKNAKIISTNLPTLNCNQIQMFQIFKNLIENGIKYNESENVEVKIDFKDEDGYITLSFEDNGIGIEPKFKDHIFEMFKRLHNRSKYTGSGLGLSIVKKITQMMGGEIVLSKSNSSGTTFNLTLPK